MARRAQGSTEYLIILGVALLVMVAAVSFVVVEPQFAYSAKKQRSDEYWASARPFTINSHAISQGHVILEMQNAEPISLTVKEIRANGVNVNFSKISSPYNESAVPMCSGGACSMPMSPGKTSIVITDNLNISEILRNICFTGDTFQEGRYYEVNLSITYQGAGGSEVQASDIPIIGQCMRIAINDTTIGTLSITTGSLPQGEIGTPYAATLTATGCAGSCTWSFTNLPWSPSSQGGTSSCNSGTSAYELTGTPSVNGTTTVTATVTDTEGRTDTKLFAIYVSTPPVELRIVTETLPDGMAGVQYTATVAATGGTYSGYTWNYTGDLPDGYVAAQKDEYYVISGITEDVRTFRPEMMVRDGNGNTASKVLNLTVVELAPLDIQGDNPLPYATINESYSTVLTASGCVGSCRWLVSGFPYASVSDPPVGGEGSEWDSGVTGLGGSNTYILSGVPAIIGNANLTVRLADDFREYSEMFVLPVYPKLQITTASPLPEGTQHQNYSAVLEADGCMQPCTWNVTLPAGWAHWTLEEDGPGGSYAGYYSSYSFVFVPNQTGTAEINAEITDSVGRVAAKTFSISINAPGAPLRITTASLPNAIEGISYSTVLQATGGAQPYLAWNPAGGWPSGLALSMPPALGGNGRLSGTPAAGTNGTYSVNVTVYDASWANASKLFNLTILPALQITTASPLPSASAGVSYSTLITATGGTGTYASWGYDSLPAGLVASYVPSTQQLRISGLPATSGTYAFNATVTDSAFHSATKEFALLVNPPNFAFTTISPLPTGAHGQWYYTTINATGCEAGDTISWEAAPLPAGVSAAGGESCLLGKVTLELSGTPSAGSYVISVNATKAGGQKISGNFALEITAPDLPRIYGAAATGCFPIRQSAFWYPNYMVNVTLSELSPLRATGGTQPYTWSCTGDMPEGVRCYPDGNFEVSTPPQYNKQEVQTISAKRVNITVTDAIGNKDSVLVWMGWGAADNLFSTPSTYCSEITTPCLPDTLSNLPSGGVGFAVNGDEVTYEIVDLNYLPAGFAVGAFSSCSLPSGGFGFSGGNAQSTTAQVAATSAVSAPPGGSLDVWVPVRVKKNAIGIPCSSIDLEQCIPVTVHSGDGWAPRN